MDELLLVVTTKGDRTLRDFIRQGQAHCFYQNLAGVSRTGEGCPLRVFQIFLLQTRPEKLERPNGFFILPWPWTPETSTA